MGLIVDSSLVIAHERGLFDFPGFLRSRGQERCLLTAISASELLHGVERANTEKRRLKRSQFVEAALHQLPVLDFDLAAARQHAALWAHLESKGQLMGAHDMLIAAAAVSGSHVLATLNTSEFSRVPGLILAEVRVFETKV